MHLARATARAPGGVGVDSCRGPGDTREVVDWRRRGQCGSARERPGDAKMDKILEHQLPLSEDERGLLQQLLYTELDAAEENVRDFEVNGPPEALDDAQDYATLVRRLYDRIRDPRDDIPTQS